MSPPSPKGGSFNPLFVKRAGVILPYPSYMSCARVSITPNPHNPLQGRGTHQSFHRGAGVKPRFFVSLRITELSRPSCILPSGRGGIFISSTFSVVNSSVFIRVHLWLQNPPGPLQAGGIIYPPHQRDCTTPTFWQWCATLHWLQKGDTGRQQFWPKATRIALRFFQKRFGRVSLRIVSVASGVLVFT